MPYVPGMGWADPAGIDVGTAIEGDFPSPAGTLPCPPPGTGPQLPPRGRDAASSVVTRMVFPPKLVKLDVSQDFNVNNYALVLPAVVGAQVIVPGFQLPVGCVGFLQSFDLYVLTPTAATSVQWTVRINQGPVPGFDNVQNPPGMAFFDLIGSDEMQVRIQSGALVDVLITNLNGNGPWTVGADFAGWYHPEQAEQRAWNLNF